MEKADLSSRDYRIYELASNLLKEIKSITKDQKIEFQNKLDKLEKQQKEQLLELDKLLEVTNNIQTAHNSEKDLIKKKNRGYLDGLAMALQKLKTIQSLIKSQEVALQAAIKQFQTRPIGEAREVLKKSINMKFNELMQCLDSWIGKDVHKNEIFTQNCIESAKQTQKLKESVIEQINIASKELSILTGYNEFNQIHLDTYSKVVYFNEAAKYANFEADFVGSKMEVQSDKLEEAERTLKEDMRAYEKSINKKVDYRKCFVSIMRKSIHDFIDMILDIEKNNL